MCVIAEGVPSPQVEPVEPVAVVQESRVLRRSRKSLASAESIKKITTKHLQTKYHIKHSPRPAEQETNEQDNSTPASTQVESDDDVEQVEQEEDEVKEDDGVSPVVIKSGSIDGKTLKRMAMGDYFKDCEIDPYEIEVFMR